MYHSLLYKTFRALVLLQITVSNYIKRAAHYCAALFYYLSGTTIRTSTRLLPG